MGYMYGTYVNLFLLEKNAIKTQTNIKPSLNKHTRDS